jgi:hypothetical protein
MPATDLASETVHLWIRRPQNAVIRVYDAAGNVIETLECKGPFQRVVKKLGRPSLERK